MARKAFDPRSTEFLVVSLLFGVGALYLIRRAMARPVMTTPTQYDDQGRPIPPIPPID